MFYIKFMFVHSLSTFFAKVVQHIYKFTIRNYGHLYGYIFMPSKELWEANSKYTVHPSVYPSLPLCVWCISPIFFEVGIPNLVCGCILGWRSVACHFLVTVTLTLISDLAFRLFMSDAYLLNYLR